MRNLKKVLALVLALVMSMSLVTIANAADFSDADNIDYTEAVDVLTALGVIDGVGNNTFNPKGTLTREQAAKILTYMLMGKGNADKLVTTIAPYSDVAANRWSAGSITYCSNVGILAGNGDGTFSPAGKLTGLAFAKMLLVALGYDAQVEGLVGSKWAINTATLATATGLISGLEDVSLSAEMTREQAAQMALNAVETPLVQYSSKGTEISVNGATVSFGAAQAEYVTTTIAKTQTISNTKLSNSDSYTIEFGEKYMTDLKKVSNDTDAFMRPATTWRYNSTTIGTFPQEADLTYTAEVKTGDIYSDLGLSKGIPASKVSYYVDGTNMSTSWTWDLVKGDVASAHAVGGNGTVTNVYYDVDTESVTVVCVNTYVAKVAGRFAATTTRDAYVTLTTPNTGAGATFETNTEFAKDDIVLYTYSNKAGDTGVQSMVKAEAVSGTMTGYTNKKSVSLDSTTYSASANAEPIVNLSNSVGKEVKVYLDQYGYAIYVDASTAAQYAVILDYAPSALLQNARAKLLFTDGKTAIVDVKNIYKADGTSAMDSWDGNFADADSDVSAYDIVSYTINSDNEYTLTLAADTNAAGVGAAKIVNGSPTLNLANSNEFNVGKSGMLISNGKTIFLVMDASGSSTTYTAYTGIANVPTITWEGGTYTAPVTVLSENSTVAKIVFIYKGTGTNISINDQNKEVTLIKGSSVGQSYSKDLGYYYEYDAIINGVAGKIKTEKPVTNYTLVSGVAYNSKGIATGWNDYAELDRATPAVIHQGTNVKTGWGTIAESNEVIGLNNTYYSYSDDCKVYYLSTTGEMTASTAASITDDVDNQVWFKLTDGVVSTLFIQIVDGTVSAPGSSGTYTATLTNSRGTATLTVTNTSASAVPVTGTVTMTNTTSGATATFDITAGRTSSGSSYTYTFSTVSTAVYRATVVVGGVSLTTNTVVGG